MGFNIERQDQTVIVTVDGRLDGANAQQFQGYFTGALDENDRAVVLNFEHLSYISSAGLRVILIAAKTLRRRDAQLVVCSLSDPIREVFQISGFDQIIQVQSTQAEAIATLNA